MFRRIVVGIVASAAVLTISSCSETDGVNKPSIEEIHAESEWQTDVLPDGRQVWCRFFAEDGYHSSWLVYTCVPKEPT
jgi:hypothetical protein